MIPIIELLLFGLRLSPSIIFSKLSGSICFEVTCTPEDTKAQFSTESTFLLAEGVVGAEVVVNFVTAIVLFSGHKCKSSNCCNCENSN